MFECLQAIVTIRIGKFEWDRSKRQMLVSVRDSVSYRTHLEGDFFPRKKYKLSAHLLMQGSLQFKESSYP